MKLRSLHMTRLCFSMMFRKYLTSIVLKSKYSTTWYFSWLLTVYFFLQHLITLCKLLSYKCKVNRLRLLSDGNWVLLREMFCTHFIMWPRFKQTKIVNNRLPDHLFFHRLCINYEAAQSFRVLLDEKRKNTLKSLKEKIL